MRSFAAAFLLFLSFLAGTAALEAYVVHEVLLDPDRAGEVLASALQQEELRDRILLKAVPGYAQLPQGARDGVDRVAEDLPVDRALAEVRITDDGTVELAPLRTALADALHRQGQDRLAERVEEAGAAASVNVPSADMDRYTRAQDTAWKVAVGGALVTLGLLVIAAAISPDRRRTVRSTGVTMLLVAAAAALLYALIPTVVRAADARPELEAIAAVVEAQRRTAWLTVLPVAVVGGVLLVASLLMPRPRRRYDDRSAF